MKTVLTPPFIDVLGAFRVTGQLRNPKFGCYSSDRRQWVRVSNLATNEFRIRQILDADSALQSDKFEALRHRAFSCL